MRRVLFIVLLLGLMGTRWDGRPIVCKTLESKSYSTGDAVLVVDVAEGVFPEDLLGKTMLYEQDGRDGPSEAVIYMAQRSGEHIKILVSVKRGSAPDAGGGAIII